MSYILEALKKAESERQLGSTPGLHAAPLQAGARLGGMGRIALWTGVAVLGLGAAALTWYQWRQWPAAPQPQPQQQPAIAVAAPAPQPVSEGPLFAPAPARPARVESAPVPKSAPVAQAAPEERHPLLEAVPEAVARELPKVAIGGYIYSKNPADRLLLVDKSLRREGDEVAPGLVLEKLLPKSAVMNYRGFRYRLPY
jgi:general secretion pathway protein B